MKNSPLLKVLLALSTVSVLLSVALCFFFISEARQLRYLQSQIAIANNTSARVNGLVGEALEYSKKNPAIDPVLEGIGAKAGKNTPAPAVAPTVKPATK
jgi:hypothetical protein